MEQLSWRNRNRIRPDRCLDRGCRDRRDAAGRNQPHLDLQQRRLEALAVGDFGRLYTTLSDAVGAAEYGFSARLRRPDLFI
jgi:hypothetical protein